MDRSRLKGSYKSFCVMFTNTAMAFLLLNLIAWGILSIVDPVSDPENVTDALFAKYGDVFDVVYPDKDRGEVTHLLQETWSRPYIYEPFTQFKEAPYSGDYVNVDENGFRHTRNQGSWPPDSDEFNVFVFGGSTVFNYGVGDNETIASHLQRFLSEQRLGSVRVYNFGRGHYYSTQERILFERLLTENAVPDLAIFIDGLNEVYHGDNRPAFTDLLAAHVKSVTRGRPQEPGFLHYARMPLFRLMSVWLTASLDPTVPANEAESITFQEDDDAAIASAIETYFANKGLIEAAAASKGVPVVFVWQPVPVYLFRRDSYPFGEEDLGRHNNSRKGYHRMAALVALEDPGANFFWCADMQQELEGPLYVDQVHYSARMSESLALEIVARLSQAGLLTGLREGRL